MKQIIFVLLAACLISACGGGNGDFISQPTDEAINASLKGDNCDKNNNGARDDLELMAINATPGNTPEEVLTRNAFIRRAQIWTEMIEVMEENPIDRGRLKELQKEKIIILYCLADGHINEPKELDVFDTHITNGSPEKRTMQHSITRELGDYWYEPSDEELIKYCNQLKMMGE